MAAKNRRRSRKQNPRTQPTSPRAHAADPAPVRSDRAVTARTAELRGPLDVRRIAIFILFAFGISWAVAAYLYWTGGLMDRPPDETLFGAPMVLVLVAVVYMGAPTFANILTRLATGEGWGNLWLELRFREGWPYWAIAWVLPGILTLLGAALYFAVMPQHFDAEFTGFREMIAAAAPDAEPPTVSPLILILLGAFQGILISPLVNGPATFGEEFGWRAYLLQKLMPLGWRATCIWMAVIWGVWHWPLIAMGHNYGVSYPGAPWSGMLVFLWFAFSAGTILNWLTIRARSVWPAVIGHGAINGIAAVGALAVIGEPNPLWGPLPVGVIGMAGFSVVALWMFVRAP
jgi:uncharacterized protein